MTSEHDKDLMATGRKIYGLSQEGKMTPERYEYEKELAAIERQTRAARKELQQLIDGALEFDLVLTIDLVPVMPPAMGRYKMVASERITRERQQKLDALRRAAEESEA